MKEYVNAYTGKKIENEDSTWTVELYSGDDLAQTINGLPDENVANAMIIPWVVQEGGTQEDKNDETDPVDPSDPLFERDFLK